MERSLVCVGFEDIAGRVSGPVPKAKNWSEQGDTGHSRKRFRRLDVN